MEEAYISFEWAGHDSHFNYLISNVCNRDLFSDATLACDGCLFPVHKLVLAACSEYFCEIFNKVQCKSPVIVLKDTKSKVLLALLDYMYLGKASLKNDDLNQFLKSAESLKIKGLAVSDDLSPPFPFGLEKENPLKSSRKGRPKKSPANKVEDKNLSQPFVVLEKHVELSTDDNSDNEKTDSQTSDADQEEVDNSQCEQQNSGFEHVKIQKYESLNQYKTEIKTEITQELQDSDSAPSEVHNSDSFKLKFFENQPETSKNEIEIQNIKIEEPSPNKRTKSDIENCYKTAKKKVKKVEMSDKSVRKESAHNIKEEIPDTINNRTDEENMLENELNQEKESSSNRTELPLLPDFSAEAQPYLKGHNLTMPEKKKMRDNLISQLIAYLDDNNLLTSGSKGKQVWGYRRIAKAMVKKYPNMTQEPSTGEYRKKHPIGFFISKVAERRRYIHKKQMLSAKAKSKEKEEAKKNGNGEEEQNK